MVTITVDQFKKIFPQNKNPQPIVDALNVVLPKYGIDTIPRIVGFLSQVGHESNGFTVMKENLNYSKEGLLKTFPKYFTESNVISYIKNPEMIASKVYANRYGNGDEKSKNGYAYRGRGFIQLTFKDNYLAFSKYLNKTLDETVVYCETVEGAMSSACWFWDTRKINDLADKKDIVAMTKAVNGGMNGFVDRQNIYNSAMLYIK